MATKPTQPALVDVPQRDQPNFSTLADGFVAWQAGLYYTWVGESNDFVEQVNTEVQAAAVATNLSGLDLASVAGFLIGVNVGGTAVEAVEITEYTVSAYSETLLDDADAAAWQTTLELIKGDAAAYRAATADRLLQADEVWTAAGYVGLTDAASIAVDLSTGINFSVTLAGNRTLANPTNVKVGQTGLIKITQDATGSRTLAFGTEFVSAGGLAPTLSATANVYDLLAYTILPDSKVLVSEYAKAVS